MTHQELKLRFVSMGIAGPPFPQRKVRRDSQGRIGFPMPPGWAFSQNLFPIAFSRNGPLEMEKRDCCELVERPVSGFPVNLPNGRKWVETRPAASGHDDPNPDAQLSCVASRKESFIHVR